MKHLFRKGIVCLLLAALALSSFASPAMAAITNAKYQGDGSVLVEWESNDAFIFMVPNMTGNIVNDLQTYGFSNDSLDSKQKAVLYFMAPGQSYWIFTCDKDENYSDPYAYNAPSPDNFDEFKQQPKFENITLKQTGMDGKTTNVNFFSGRDIESDLEYTTYSAQIKFTWIFQKETHSYIGQTVIVTPDKERIVQDAYQMDIPKNTAGGVKTTVSLQKVFKDLYQRRGSIPVGTYIFSIYWDGKLVCSTTFNVR